MSGERASWIEEAACDWAARIDRGLRDDEPRLLAEWLEGDARRRGALLRAQAALSVLDRGRALGTGEDEGEEEAHPLSSRFSRRRMLSLGGGIAAVLVAGIGWRVWPMSERLATRVGEIRRLPLEDGSMAVVNTGTRLRFAFTERRRDVELADGEAWFQVAKNHARPFVVSTGPARVQAVGTAFDVRRHPRATEVMVTEGTVKVWSDGEEDHFVHVRAGQRAVVLDRGGVTVADISPARFSQQLAWREGRIVLDDMTLASAAEEFNRYHQVQLEVDPAIADKRLVGWFRTDDLDGFVNASATVVGGRIERDEKIIRILQ